MSGTTTTTTPVSTLPVGPALATDQALVSRGNAPQLVPVGSIVALAAGGTAKLSLTAAAGAQGGQVLAAGVTLVTGGVAGLGPTLPPLATWPAAALVVSNRVPGGAPMPVYPPAGVSIEGQPANAPWLVLSAGSATFVQTPDGAVFVPY